MSAANPTPTPAEITPELIAEHGLSDEEYARLLDIMGREPVSYTHLTLPTICSV